MTFTATSSLRKEVLETKRRELFSEIRSQTAQLSIDQSEHDPTDQVQSMSRRDQAAGFVGRLSRVLAQVEKSLEAISDGSYGLCLDCGEPIADRRLKAMPWATHCLRCQEMLETQQPVEMRRGGAYQDDERAA